MIVAKATSDETIEEKRSKGADAIELQLMNGVPKISNFSLPIVSVHTRLAKGEDVAFDELFFTPANNVNYVEGKRFQFLKACELAESIAEAQGMRVLVVVHLHQEYYPYNSEVIASYLSWVLNEYKLIDIAVENCMTIDSKGRVRAASTKVAVPIYVEYLKVIMSEYGMNDRIFSVLDICHAVSSIRIAATVNGSNCNEFEEIEEFFREFEKNCKIVHFNYLEGYGVGKGHGTTMPEGVLCKLYGMCRKYVPDAYFVVEIREDDYSNSVNFLKTRNQLIKLMT